MARYDIGIIGAGISGICAGIQLQKKFGITVSFTVFEQNTDVGGTWLSNVYPGCGCDTASHLYSYSFEQNPNWSNTFASQPEILDYLKNLTVKYELYQHIKLQHEVKMVSWDEKLMKWIVRFVNVSIPNAEEETQMFDIIISAPGGLRVPNIPNEYKGFTGPIMHTAEWNEEIDLKNKKVAVIGSGASAIQVIPNIVDNVDTLHCYQRKPPFILSKLQLTIPNFMKKLFLYLPFLMWIIRCFLYIRNELLLSAFYPDTIWHKMATRDAKKYRQKELKNHKHLWDDLTPNYSFGCKRVLVSELYYSAIARLNVRIHRNRIEKIVNQTIYTEDGLKEEIDVVILATGFRVQDFYSPMEVFGIGGENLLKSWIEKEPRSFYGIASSVAPNNFALLGPNTGLGHNSIIFMIECQMNFIINLIREMMNRNARVACVKAAAEDEFMDKIKNDLKNTVWQKGNCASWYANSRGDITALWGDNCTNYWRQTRNIDWSKFDFI